MAAGQQAPDELQHLVKEVIQAYEARLARLRTRVTELEHLLTLERQSKLAIEAQLQQVKDEVEGLLKGGVSVTKQAWMLVMDMAEKHNGIVNAAKYLKRSKIPWTTIITGIVASIGLGSAAYILSVPGNMSLLTTFLSSWVNQVFILSVVIAVLLVLYLINRRRKAVELA
ncbi:MAG: hypothetical protein QXQ70_03180 [Candidatus Caldarchaeum sp.]